MADMEGTNPMPFHHGTPPRGLGNIPSSPSFEGRFGRMFRNLPVFDQDMDALKALAERMISPPEENPTPPGEVDSEENEAIPAGYTYLGQFIDHDITFDPASSLQRQNDPDALTDFRTPRFDLDNIYGRGPDEQPYLYEPDGLKLQLGERVDDPSDPSSAPFGGPDLQRNVNHRALIGDPRNDENLIVSQLQTVFMRLHNQMLERVRIETGFEGGNLFQETQRRVRWHYQWVVVHDFLPRIVGAEVVQDILQPSTHRAGGSGGQDVDTIKPKFQFYKVARNPYMPVEFSVAAYRFGHSMVRPEYLFNDFVRGKTGGKRTPIFSLDQDPLANLNGFRTLPSHWGFQWKFLFDRIETGSAEERVHPQFSYKIDSHLVNPLGALPFASEMPSLAERNLVRGKQFGLPSGQSVALAMGFEPLTNDQLGIDDLPGLAGHAPLWYYILKEAEIQTGGAQLGAVGGRIVAEVLLGLLWGDPLSYLRVQPTWQPDADLSNSGKFEMPELVRFALGS